MNKVRKILVVIGAYIFLLLIDGCINCNCPNNIPPYFDFQKIIQEVNETSLSDSENLEITLSLDSILYLAQLKKRCFNLGLINSAVACSCLSPGEAGMKIPLSEIRIVSDQEVNPTLPAGSSLDSVFNLIELQYDDSQISEILLADINLSQSTYLRWEGSRVMLKLKGRPQELGVPHIFTILFKKSNGEVISTVTPPIIWN